MYLTNNQSIQEVLFFPQMRPEKKAEVSTEAGFEAVGVPTAWIPVLQKMGFMTVEALKAGNPNKIFNDLGGMRKKMKLEISMPNKEDVVRWTA